METGSSWQLENIIFWIFINYADFLVKIAEKQSVSSQTNYIQAR